MPVTRYAHLGSENTAVAVTDDKLVVTDPDRPTGQSNAPITTLGKKGTPVHSRKAPTGAASSALASNASRISATFQNVGSVDIWLRSDGTAAANAGFLLAAGKSLVDTATTAAWSMFVASGTGALEVVEIS